MFSKLCSQWISVRWNLPENVHATQRSKPSRNQFSLALYLPVTFLVVTETGITHHAGEHTLNCSRPSVSLSGLSPAAQAHLNLASLIAAGVDGGIGFTPTMWVGGQDGTERRAISGTVTAVRGIWGCATPLPLCIRTWQTFSGGDRERTRRVHRWHCGFRSGH